MEGDVPQRSPEPDSIARRLDRLRLERGWSWADVARQTTIPHATLTAMARGAREGWNLSLRHSFALARVFGVSLDWLVARWTDDPERRGHPLDGEHCLTREGTISLLLSMAWSQEFERHLARMDGAYTSLRWSVSYDRITYESSPRSRVSPAADPRGDGSRPGRAGL